MLILLGRDHLATALVQLATESTGNSLAGVGVGEEAGGVGLDHLDSEALAGVDLVVIEDTSDEGALEAADGAAALLIANGVGESDTRRTGLALDTLVDVSGSLGRGLVVTTEAKEGDVVANDILVRVDTILEDTVAALEATGELVLHVDDLVGGGQDIVGGGEGEGNTGVLVLGLALVEKTLVVLGGIRSGRGDGQGAESEGDERELHFDG